MFPGKGAVVLAVVLANEGTVAQADQVAQRIVLTGYETPSHTDEMVRLTLAFVQAEGW